MKKTAFLAVLIVSVLAASLSAAAAVYGTGVKELKCSPSRVTVYNGWALVKRDVKISLSQGESSYAVPDLPPGVMHNSISVSKQDREAAFVVKEFEYRDVITEAEESPEIKPLKDKIEVLRSQLRAKEDRTAVLDQQIKFYASILAKSADEASKAAGVAAVSPDNLAQTVKFVSNGTESSLKEKRSIERELIKMKEEISILESQLNRSRSGVAAKKALFITLSSGAPAEAGIEISYVVSGVSWQPAYEADFNTSKNSVEGRYNAVMKQYTGEDWERVKLTMAAGTPLFDVTLPEPNPWVINEYKPPVVYRAKAGGAMPQAMKAAAAPMMEESAAEDYSGMSYDSSVAAVSDSGAGIDVELSGRYSIDGRGTEKKIFIKNIKFGTGELNYLAVPSQNEYAYLTAEFENKDEIPLVPGDVAIYMDGNYTGKARIEKRIAMGEKTSFPFGIDERIKITRDKLWQKKGESGLFGGNDVTDFAFRIKIENFRKNSVKLTLKEPLPFAQHDKIKVDMYEVSPEITETKDRGITEWKLELKPGSKNEVNYKFRIIHPKEMQVTGY